MYLNSVRITQPVSGYVRHLPVVRRLTQAPLELAPVTILAGDNGSGKSTLIEAIAAAMGANPAGGSRYAQFTAADHSDLHRSLTLTRRENPRDVYFLRGETYLDLAEYHESLGPEDPLVGLTRRSHGQGIMQMARERFGPQSLIILDEPEDGLSVFSQLELLGLLTVLVRRGAQVVVATHSPVLLAIPEALILRVPELEPVLYDDCEAVTATQEFINDPAATARYLVEP